MFGFFKKNKANEDSQFESLLDIFADDFDYIIQNTDPESGGIIKSRAYNNYYKRDPEESKFTASDFYLDAYTGAMFELTDRRVIDAAISLQVFYLVNEFLTNNRRYQTPLTERLMKIWEEKINRLGVHRSY